MRTALLALALVGCAPVLATVPPEREGLDGARLVQLARAIRDDPAPVFSILISRHGRLVFELYTGGITRDDAHYLMSVTKTLVSALIGIAVDEKLLRTDQPITALFPRALFDADPDRFRTVTLKDVLAMSALDSPDPPRDRSPAAWERHRQFNAVVNRVAFALTQPVLTAPGQTFQYNDVNPVLATGALQYATRTTALAFAEQHLFGPLGFRNYEWMHQDPSGIDNGGYGLRLRPIDMQKLGVLYLNRGVWQGRRLISAAWVDQSFQPWIHGNYGWFWWTYDFGPGWVAHVANGWKGQRIAVFPDQGIVVTMTACFEDGAEDAFFSALVRSIVIPAATAGAHPARGLDGILNEIAHQRPRRPPGIEPRMVPSVQPKGPHRGFSAGG